jgi:hypothetical protein
LQGPQCRFKLKRSSITLTLSGLTLIFLACAHQSPREVTPAIAAQRARGVILLPPGEDMDTRAPEQPGPARPAETKLPDEEPKAQVRLGKVSIAVTGDNPSRLAGLVGRDAPFEIVGLSDKPDLVWDPVSRETRSGPAVIAYDVELPSLAAVIDRTAAVRELSRQTTLKPQTIRLAGTNQIHHKGETIQLVVDNIADRALLLVAIAGDGATQLLYPLGADTPVPRSSPYKRDLILREPFGTDVVVAISSPSPISRLELLLKDASRPLGAVEFLSLVKENLPSDAFMGLLTVTTTP